MLLAVVLYLPYQLICLQRKLRDKKQGIYDTRTHKPVSF
jgi:hypothetical protein